MQDLGLLDSVSQEQLDSIDRLIFEPRVLPAVRAEALAFLMAHTVGFTYETDGADEVAIRSATYSAKRKHNGKSTSCVLR